MLVDENKSLAHRVYEAFNSRNLDALDELLSSDFVDHYPGSGQEPGVEGIKQVWAQIWTKFPDIQIVVEDMLGERDKVMARLTFQRTSPRGNETIGRAIEIFRVAEGSAVEVWNMLELV